MNAAGALRRIGAFLHTWLEASDTHGRRTRHGRYLHIGLTATLLVAGLAAWALALVQPWKAHAADPGILAVAGQPAPQRVRAAAAEAEHLVDAVPMPPLPVLARNPFETAEQDASTAEPGTEAQENPSAAAGGFADGPRGDTATGREVPADVDGTASGAPTARQVAETVRGLELKATVRSTRGERWAVINNKVYRAGDEVAGLILVEIGENRATLRRGAVTCVLRMD